MKTFTLFLPVVLVATLAAVLVVAIPDAPAARIPSPPPLPPPPGWRCAVDKLDTTAALQRKEWDQQCFSLPGASSMSSVGSKGSVGSVGSMSSGTPPATLTYPIYESVVTAGGGTQLVPLPTMPGNGCSLFAKNGTTGNFSRWTGSFYLVGYCEVLP